MGFFKRPRCQACGAVIQALIDPFYQEVYCSECRIKYADEIEEAEAAWAKRNPKDAIRLDAHRKKMGIS